MSKSSIGNLKMASDPHNKPYNIGDHVVDLDIQDRFAEYRIIDSRKNSFGDVMYEMLCLSTGRRYFEFAEYFDKHSELVNSHGSTI